jgi:hypothetical protein
VLASNHKVGEERGKGEGGRGKGEGGRRKVRYVGCHSTGWMHRWVQVKVDVEGGAENQKFRRVF